MPSPSTPALRVLHRKMVGRGGARDGRAVFASFVLFASFVSCPVSALGPDESKEVTKVGFETDASEVTESTWAIAVMLFGFLIMNMSILYLINLPDENIRCYIHKMISVTISIFCAVLMNQAAFSFVLMQLFPSPWPRGFGMHVGIKEKFVTGFLFVTASFLLINVLCATFRANKDYLFAVTSVGGHLCAFAGIFTFGELQQAGFIKHNIWRAMAILLLAQIVLTLYRVLTEILRTRWPFVRHGEYHGLLDTSTATVLSEEATVGITTEDEDEWIEMAKEAEDEALILIMSFLAHQCLCFIIAGEMPNMEGDELRSKEKEVVRLFYASLVCLALLVCATYVRVSSKAHGWTKRFMSNTQNFISMSMSWCLQNMGNWQMNMWLKERKHLAGVLNAFAMTTLSVLIIIVLDFVADALRDHGTRDAGASIAVSVAPAPIAASPLNGEIPLQRTCTANTSEGRGFRRSLCTVVTVQDVRDKRSWERPLRTIIAGFGLLVALSWDKAFDVADITIVEGLQRSPLASHPVFSRILIAMTLVCFVFPAWLKFMVPLARADEAYFREQIEMEKALLRGLDGDRLADTAEHSPGMGTRFYQELGRQDAVSTDAA